MSTNDVDDRREYYRIEDTIALEFTLLAGAEAQASDELHDPSPLFNLLSDLHLMDFESQHLLRHISERDRTLANYLKVINKRIDLLGQAALPLILLVVLVVLGMVFALPALTMLAWVPLLVSGVALIHGLIGLKGMNGLWLVAFYVLLLTTWPMILIVLLLGFIDSFADFRGRLARSQ